MGGGGGGYVRVIEVCRVFIQMSVPVQCSSHQDVC